MPQFDLAIRGGTIATAAACPVAADRKDIAVAGAAVSLTLDAGGACADARIVLGAVAPTATFTISIFLSSLVSIATILTLRA